MGQKTLVIGKEGRLATDARPGRTLRAPSLGRRMAQLVQAHAELDERYKNLRRAVWEAHCLLIVGAAEKARELLEEAMKTR